MKSDKKYKILLNRSLSLTMNYTLLSKETYLLRKFEFVFCCYLLYFR